MKHTLQKKELQRPDLSMRHKDKHKTAFLRSLRLEEIRINRAYVRKSQHAKHYSGYQDLVYYKRQRHDHRNPTRKHRLK